MKKYLLGLTAIVAAIAFSAFTKPTSALDFHLIIAPTSAGVVELQSNWEPLTADGQLWGLCDVTPEDLACFIILQTTTMSKYYNNASGDPTLNTETYARATYSPPPNDPRFLAITEAIGLSPYRKIASIVPMKLVAGPGSTLNAVEDTDVIIVKANALSTNDGVYWNARLSN